MGPDRGKISFFRLELLKTLSDDGKDISYFEEQIGTFVIWVLFDMWVTMMTMMLMMIVMIMVVGVGSDDCNTDNNDDDYGDNDVEIRMMIVMQYNNINVHGLPFSHRSFPFVLYACSS